MIFCKIQIELSWEKNMKKAILLPIIILFFVGVWFELQNVDRPKIVNYELLATNYGKQTAAINGEQLFNNQEVAIVAPKQTELPFVFDLKVPFVSQAPFADWDPLHNEACEEASMIMVAKYFKKEKLDKEIMENEIQKLVQWEMENGYPIDLTAEKVVEVLDKYFRVKSEVSSEVTVEKIKSEIVAGKLIILPLAGRFVPNPYYRQPGPLYHMLIIRGFDEDEFITNDPGTKRGERFKYLYGDLLWAVHDWTGEARQYKDPRPEPDMEKGERVMIIVGD